jgi:precorrin-6B C5,15-methyltransferase / cobalt-precorrin-6B C5,C15-methyltransferase
MQPWLHIAGLGPEGPTPALRALLDAADIIIGGARHHALAPGGAAERITWPTPFDRLTGLISGHRGRRVVVLVSGDPGWYSAGTAIAAAFPGETIIHPAPGAFSLAAARMGWALQDCDCLTCHGRPVAGIIPALIPGAKLLILTAGAEDPGRLARLLAERGLGPSRMTVLAAMGGPDERHVSGTAADWAGTVPDFHTLAIAVIAGPGARVLTRAPGLPDAMFAHDGTMTKQEVRAITLAALAPRRGALLWDVGCGAGSVAVEWMRAAPGAQAIGIEPRADRRAYAAQNALALGTPDLTLIDGTAPAALAGLPAPDAVFFGGGVTAEAVAIAMTALNPLGRVVANAVTLESEAVLLHLHATHGGSLTRIAISRAEPVGGLTGWRPLMPVTQWVWGA